MILKKIISKNKKEYFDIDTEIDRTQISIIKQLDIMNEILEKIIKKEWKCLKKK